MTATAEDPRWLDDGEMRAWRAYVIASELLRKQLNRELQDRHGLALADYEVLVRLSEQDGGQMRMAQLAGEVASSKSRLSHQIGRMETAGLVRRVECGDDARGVFAEITEAGRARLRETAPTHVAGVRAHLVDLLTAGDQTALAEIFERVLDHLGHPEH
ncbi:DNA-binding MarR family transcriptional regulator [Actinophytocola algeriensis]|uniref:DNA-binding MarR family transcriptional regulator n=2 Tax=Actinophytocola algeriensis TaxID=1768010 RepID=A0A7W7Q3Y0_9PSEU|nr:MarR family transcriptional regulator [Actinophytocola algeriensis]MBB4906378.1 DNA-binding MarR family transcriptional regulator [Actinophytocola algeriensis]MBE1477859.1 DNA-binding MarR family transcriptional regulator [Actinophytocola algeriensis]